MWCKIFGHKFRPFGRFDTYGRWNSLHAIDGIGREHREIQLECQRCGEYVDICKVHLPPRDAEEKVRKRLAEAERLLQCGYGDGI